MNKDFFYEMIKYKQNVFSALMEDYKQSTSTLPIVEECIQRLEKEEHIDLESLLSHHSIAEYLSQYDKDFNWDYSDELQQLSLLSKEELEKLSLYFGIALHSKEIAHTIEKDKLLDLKAQLSDELYLFAIERGQYLFNNVNALFSQRNKQAPLLEKIHIHGELALYALAKSWPEKQRKKLNFFTTQPENTPFELNEKEFQSLYFALKKILTLEVGSLLYV